MQARFLSRFLFSAAALSLASLLLLAGCASAPVYAPGQAILKGEVPAFPPPPDSLRAELQLTAFSRGRKSSVSAALSAKPYARYKLDLFGLPGMVEGSLLWTPERWTLVIFGEEAFLEGEGESVEIGNLGLRDVSVHDAFSFLWGALPGLAPAGGDSILVPGLTRVDEGVFEYMARGDRLWRLFLDGKTGQVRQAMRADSSFRIEYGEYEAGKGTAGGTAARKARLFGRSGPLLEIRVKNVEADPHWRRDPFFLKVPKGFRRLERAPE